MSRESITRHADRVVASLAAGQHGVGARWQLLDLGVTPEQIRHRLRTSRLHEIHRGVYLVGHAVAPRYAPEMAALLACGPDVALGTPRAAAVLSHRSAAALWGLVHYPAPAPACVTVAPERSVARPLIEIHRSMLERRDVRVRHGLALTSPPRTILDLAAGLDRASLEQLVAEAEYRRLASASELGDQLARNRGKRGTPALHRVLGLPGAPQRTRSPAEPSLLRMLRRAGLSGYALNQRIHGYEVDVLWRQHRFAIELDGYDGHSGRVAFERDRLKAARLKAEGVEILPVTPRQLHDDPEGVLARLVAALRRAGYPD